MSFKMMKKEEINNKLFNQASVAWDKGRLKKAFELYSKAALNGDPGSQLNLGYFYDEGIYVRKDQKKALYWYKKAYRQGEGAAANNIALYYKSTKEYRKALWWFHKAVSLKALDALYEIGRLYEDGLGVKADKAKAAFYYRQVLASGKYATQFTKEQAGKVS